MKSDRGACVGTAGSGVEGTLGKSDWDYDVNVARTQDRLQEKQWVRWKDKTDQYFIDHVLGPQQGLDPYYHTYPVYTPNYAAFYQPIAAADMAAMTGHINTHSKTYDESTRGQVMKRHWAKRRKAKSKAT